MRKITIVNMLIAFVLVLGSCATSNDVVSNRLISKRKFNKGFHINSRSHLKSNNGSQEQEVLALEGEKEKESKTEKKAATQKKIVSPKSTVTKEQIVKSVAEVSKDVNQNTTARNEVKDNVASSDQKSASKISSVENTTKKSDVKINLKEVKKAKKARSSSAASNSGLLNIILIVLLVLAIITLLSLISGPLGWILSVVLLVLAIYFLLRLLGAI